MTYETVVAATHGDPVAAEEVLEHFDSAIDGLCTHAFVDEGGHTEYGVDTQMKTEMQGSMIAIAGVTTWPVLMLFPFGKRQI